MFSISNEELKKCPKIEKTILCPHCGEVHEIKYGEQVLEDGSRIKSDLTYYNCGSKSYLAGVAGKFIG